MRQKPQFLCSGVLFPLLLLASHADDSSLFTRIDSAQHTVGCACAGCSFDPSGGTTAPLAAEAGGSSGFAPAPVVVAPSLGSFDIVINPNGTLAGNAAALDAFERAAATWESFISDPITVTIDAGLSDLGNPNIIGQASSVLLQAGYDTIRNQMVADASFEADDGIVASLPTAAQSSFTLPAGFSDPGLIVGNKAALKAMGFTGLDDPGFGGPTDATITFNSTFAFDFNNADGVTAGQIDFESVALHEIGHALGFTSAVDSVDFLANQGTPDAVAPFALDLFRFADGQLPTDSTEFTSNSRSLEPGAAVSFSDVDMEGSMSTGRFTGDGQQASHWKDNGQTGVLLGTMDPTLAPTQVLNLSALDLRALDMIGYDIAFIPEPSILTLACLGLLAWRRRR